METGSGNELDGVDCGGVRRAGRKGDWGEEARDVGVEGEFESEEMLLFENSSV